MKSVRTLLPDSSVYFFMFPPTCSTLSQCCHAIVALLYPFVWQHTYIPVLPPAMLDIVCTPTPFIVGLLSSSLPQLTELPLEEVGESTILCNSLETVLISISQNDLTFLCAGSGRGSRKQSLAQTGAALVITNLLQHFVLACQQIWIFSLLCCTQLDDEDSILPSKLQSALETVLERRRELANERGGDTATGKDPKATKSYTVCKI